MLTNRKKKIGGKPCLFFLFIFVALFFKKWKEKEHYYLASDLLLGQKIVALVVEDDMNLLCWISTDVRAWEKLEIKTVNNAWLFWLVLVNNLQFFFGGGGGEKCTTCIRDGFTATDDKHAYMYLCHRSVLKVVQLVRCSLLQTLLELFSKSCNPPTRSLPCTWWLHHSLLFFHPAWLETSPSLFTWELAVAE